MQIPIPNAAICLFKFCSLPLMTVCNLVCILFHEYNIGKMKIIDGIKIFSFSIEKVLKKYGKCLVKMCGNPVYCGNRLVCDENSLTCHFSMRTFRRQLTRAAVSIATTDPANILFEIAQVRAVSYDCNSFWEKNQASIMKTLLLIGFANCCIALEHSFFSLLMFLIVIPTL